MELEQRSDNRNTATGSQSAARALAVLDVLGDASGELGVREIARQLSLAPSVVQRLIQSMAARGYIERANDGQKYRVGLRAFQVGRRYLAYNGLHAASLPELRMMAEREQVNAYLGVLRDRTVVYLDAVQSTGPIAIVSKPGSSASLHSTAFGKALLAELPDEQIESLVGPGPFVRFTKKTKTSLTALMKDIRQVRRTHWAFSDEENIDNVFAAGAVIRDASGEGIGALSGALPRHQLNAAAIVKLSRIVLEAADRISHRLGAAPARLVKRA